MTNVARQLIYGFCAVWLIIASVYRVLIMVTRGQDLDAVPFVSCCLGFVLLAVLLIDRPIRVEYRRSDDES